MDRIKKADLERSARLLTVLCPGENFAIKYWQGQPRLVRRVPQAGWESVSPRGTKTQVDQYIKMVIVGVKAGRNDIKEQTP